MKRLAPVFLFAVVLFSCSKKTSPLDNTKVFTAELREQADDALRVSNELDAAFNDVDSVLENQANVCGGAFAINTADTPNVIAITYNGNTCDALRSRTGSINITYPPGARWDSVGDSINVLFNNLGVTRLSDGKTLVFYGNFTYRNLSGGKLSNLAAGSTVIHSIAGSGIQINYDGLVTTSWRFTRERTYTNNSGIVVSTVGTDSAGSVGHVADWGANRWGNSILLVPTTPLQLSQSCGWKLTGGQATLSNPSGTSILSFGLDSTGKTTSCPLAGSPYYYKLDWSGIGENPYSSLFPY
ncbi:MAG TPA: hypothetical protein VHE34_14505 [Puia sp.]|uniref:hypothetical protein n=1 Tax=Puia sp. TaxID=2045100 RepID=UPI002CBAED55|nr:hypothetical protein [Puia sp.]HVU96436.1 hypothetical protein [Puia sp.]